MATGLITSPNPWLLGTVAPPDWFQTAQDDINLFFATLKVSTSAISATLPSPATLGATFYKDTAPFAMCSMLGAGTFRSGFNIASVARTGIGAYNITLQRDCAGQALTYCSVNVVIAGAAISAAASVNSTGPTVIRVITYDSTAVSVDSDFQVIVWTQQ